MHKDAQPLISEPEGIRTLNHQIDHPAGTAAGDNAKADLGEARSKCAVNSPELSRVIAAWPSLPEPIRRAITAMLDAVE
jgi:hypothetical protein